MDDEIKKMLSEILTAVKGLEGRASRTEQKSSVDMITEPTTASGEKRKSIKEFLLECSPSSGVQTVLAIGYYLENYEGVTPFNAADLKKGFRAAKETPPANVNDTANWCVKNGHFMEEPEKKDSMKTWVVTRSGEQYVQQNFAGDNDRKK